MKKPLEFLFLLIITSLISTSPSQAGEIDVWGEKMAVDTFVYKPVGPGMMYAHLRLPNYPVELHITTIDLHNKYNKIETWLANDSLPTIELVTKACKRKSYDGHEAIVGVNGDFYMVSSQTSDPNILGMPCGGSISGGEMQREPDSNWWGFACMTEDKKPYADYISFQCVVNDGKGNTKSFKDINRYRPADGLTFYNRYCGKYTRTDNNGTEIYIKPIEGETWGTNRDVICEVTQICQNKGKNLIPIDGGAILSGAGSGKSYLETFVVGQRITVNMGLLTLSDNTRPNINELVGGNAILMKNGVLTDRNESDGYNSSRYPRTSIAYSADQRWVYLLVADGKQGTFSDGITTKDMCGILYQMGARNIVGLDGGGSAEMIVNHKVMNRPSDGSERPVGNGWIAFSTAPKDETIASLVFENHNLQVPIFSELNPKVLGYNQYGALVNDNVQGVTLSCSPNIGKINSSGNFSANGSVDTGTLTATYNGISVTSALHVIKADLALRMDSMLIDARKDYPLQVQSKVDQNIMIADPAAFTWTVSDQSLCTLNNGYIKGVQNGTFTVTGGLNDFSGTMKVKVEIPSSDYYIQEKFDNPTLWKITAQSNWNLKFDSQYAPSEWEYGSGLNYTFQTSRAPSIKMTRVLPFYSLPDSAILIFNPGNIIISKIVVGLRTNNSSDIISKEYTGFTTNNDNQLIIDISDYISNTDDLIHYPIWLDYITFYINAASQVTNTNYTLALKELAMCYRGISVGITTPTVPTTDLMINNPVKQTAIINLGNTINDEVKADIYTLQGKLIYSRNLGYITTSTVSLPIEFLPNGNYVIRLTLNDAVHTGKMTIKH